MFNLFDLFFVGILLFFLVIFELMVVGWIYGENDIYLNNFILLVWKRKFLLFSIIGCVFINVLISKICF